MLPNEVPGVGDDVLEVARMVRRWADRELIPKRAKHGEDYEGLLLPALEVLRHEVGIGEMISDGESFCEEPAELPLLWALCLAQVGRGDCGLGLLIAVELALARAGAGCEGERVALALPRLMQLGDMSVEALGGRAPQATARPAGEGWLVSGDAVTPLCSGGAADRLAVVCLDDDLKPLLALVPASGKGVSVGDPILQTGLAASRNARVKLEDAPAERVLPYGADEQARLNGWLRLGLAGVCTGALEMALEILIDWAESRVIKGKGQSFMDNPLTAGVMAEVAGDLLVCRALLAELARRLEGDDGPVLAAELWGRCSSLAERSIGRAMELMASAGYAREWQLERYWRDVRTLRGLLGNPTLARMELAAALFGSRGLLS